MAKLPRSMPQRQSLLNRNMLPGGVMGRSALPSPEPRPLVSLPLDRGAGVGSGPASVYLDGMRSISSGSLQPVPVLDFVSGFAADGTIYSGLPAWLQDAGDGYTWDLPVPGLVIYTFTIEFNPPGGLTFAEISDGSAQNTQEWHTFTGAGGTNRHATVTAHQTVTAGGGYTAGVYASQDSGFAMGAEYRAAFSFIPFA